MKPAANILARAHRPWPLPAGPWVMVMRWTDLLFAHWPISPEKVEQHLPAGLELDTFDGAAWLGIIPFRMEQVRLRGTPSLPGNRHFLEMNVRTYVREPRSGHRGVYFFSLDTNNPLAAVGARAWYRLPYFWARMHARVKDGWIEYRSRRLFSHPGATLDLRYREAGPFLGRSQPGTIEHFLTERYALFTASGQHIFRADIHHHPWRLQTADAAWQDWSVAAAQGFSLAGEPKLIHFSKSLDILAWPPRKV